MLDTEQLNTLQKVELSQNSEAYIKAMQAEIDAISAASSTIEERIKLNDEELYQAQKQLDIAEMNEASAAKTAEHAKDAYEAALQNANATDLEERASAAKTAQENLEAATKARETAEERVNTATKNANTLATEKQTLADRKETLATQSQTVAKSLLTKVANGATKAFQVLKAAIVSNPIGAILTAITLAISAIRGLLIKIT